MRPVRGVLGRATMGKTAEGRSELAELADDSASSADATIPSSPARAARSMSMTERRSVPLCFERKGSGTWEPRCKTLARIQTNSHSRNDTDSGDAEERRETKQRAARPGRAPQDHHGVLAMLNTTARAQKGKQNTGRLNEGVTEKIKARAWRNKSKRCWGKDKD